MNELLELTGINRHTLKKTSRRSYKERVSLAPWEREGSLVYLKLEGYLGPKREMYSE